MSYCLNPECQNPQNSNTATLKSSRNYATPKF
ncbi:4-Cys prefix domain-containing protein [Microcoleus sp. N3A4]